MSTFEQIQEFNTHTLPAIAKITGWKIAPYAEYKRQYGTALRDPSPHSQQNTLSYYSGESKDGYGEFRVSSDSVSVKLDVPVDTAVRIAALLESLSRERAA